MVSQGSWRLKRKYHGIVWGSLLVVTFSVKAAKKGKASMGALMSAGTRPGGLNPICGASMWKSFGIPAMLYGCENVTATEKAFKFVCCKTITRRAHKLTQQELLVRSECGQQPDI